LIRLHIPESSKNKKKTKWQESSHAYQYYYQLPSQKTLFDKLDLKGRSENLLLTTDPPNRNKQWLRVKDWKKIYQANAPPKAGRSSNTYIRQSNFKLTLAKQDKEGHFILIKGRIHQKEMTIINLYASSVSAPNFIKHTLKDFKAHIDSNTVVVEDFSIPLSTIDRSSRQKIQQRNPRTK
jgi:hypothetical protein